VIAFGRIKDADLAEHMLASDEADLIGMARQLIADPETPRKLLEGRASEVRACIACNDGCLHAVAQEKPIRCVQNPAAGQELLHSERLLVRAPQPKYVVVVGGGPAGLKVAEIAARRGHSVTLFEREGHLGGQVRLGARQPHHGELAEVVHYLEAAVRRLGVEVWTGAEVDAAGLLELGPDVVVVATGSQPNLPATHRQSLTDPDSGAIARERGLTAGPELPGLDLPLVYSSDEVLAGATLPGQHVLVVDEQGHWEAVGTMEFLATSGHRVTAITSRSTVGSELEGTNYAMFLQRVGKLGITMRPLTALRAVEQGRALLVDVVSGEEEWLEADAIVPVSWRRSRDDLYYRLQDLVAESGAPMQVERVGDAAAARLVQTVLLEAHRLGAVL